MCSLTILLARVCISVIFIIAGLGKFLEFDATAKYMASVGLPYVPYLLVVAAVVELLGGLFLLVGWNARFGAAMLLVFLIPTTYFFHNFWAVSPAMAQIQLIEFLKNLAVFGGLLYVLTYGAGGLSFDGCGQSCSKDKK